jgi:hypothetical protein
MEAKASRNPETIAGAANGGGLRGLVSGLVPSRSNSHREPANGHVDPEDPGARLDEYLSDSSARVLHDLHLPDGGEISHLVVGPAGITVIDSRNYTSGRAKVGTGGLRVGRRNRSKLVHEVMAKAEEIENLLVGTPYEDTLVEGALAWREVEGLPTLHSFTGPRILVCGTRKIAKEAARPGHLTARKVTALTKFLDGQLTG